MGAAASHLISLWFALVAHTRAYNVEYETERSHLRQYREIP
jgi:hypothetical protein